MNDAAWIADLLACGRGTPYQDLGADYFEGLDLHLAAKAVQLSDEPLGLRLGWATVRATAVCRSAPAREIKEAPAAISLNFA
jgi:hypothetical protein